MAFGDWFREERDKRGWSQAWVARRIGISRQQMNSIEKGRSRAGAETLQALCALFETTPGQILASADAPPQPQSAQAEPQAHISCHPGVEALAGDAQLRARHHVTDTELQYARQIITPRPIQTVEGALRLIEALRCEEPLG